MGKYIHKDSKQYFAFNIWSIESAKAIIDAAAAKNMDAVLQTSMRAFKHLDKRQLREYTDSYGKALGTRVYLHLDHCREIRLIQEAIDYGWDSVMFDASEKAISENAAILREVNAIASPAGILVEAEIGHITGEQGTASIEDVKKFLEETRVDMLAVAIGTQHGLYKSTPRLDYGLLQKVTELTDIPLVVHGGTGLSDTTFLCLLSYSQVKKINISTDVKQSYQSGLLKGISGWQADGQDLDPIKVTADIHDAIMDMAFCKLALLEDSRFSRESEAPS